MTKRLPIFAVQWFKEDKWTSIFISSYLPDAEATFSDLDTMVPRTPIRLVRFLVDSFDFIATQTTDFAVVRTERV